MADSEFDWGVFDEAIEGVPFFSPAEPQEGGRMDLAAPVRAVVGYRRKIAELEEDNARLEEELEQAQSEAAVMAVPIPEFDTPEYKATSIIMSQLSLLPAKLQRELTDVLRALSLTNINVQARGFPPVYTMRDTGRKKTIEQILREDVFPALYVGADANAVREKMPSWTSHLFQNKVLLRIRTVDTRNFPELYPKGFAGILIMPKTNTAFQITRLLAANDAGAKPATNVDFAVIAPDEPPEVGQRAKRYRVNDILEAYLYAYRVRVAQAERRVNAELMRLESDDPGNPGRTVHEAPPYMPVRLTDFPTPRERAPVSATTLRFLLQRVYEKLAKKGEAGQNSREKGMIAQIQSIELLRNKPDFDVVTDVVPSRRSFANFTVGPRYADGTVITLIDRPLDNFANK